MSWLYLALAIIAEVIGTTALKFSNGFTHIPASVTVFVAYGASFVFLGLCLKTIELGIAYAIWAGVGTALIACIGFALFKEPITPLKLVSIGLIVVGVIGLNLAKSSNAV